MNISLKNSRLSVWLLRRYLRGRFGAELSVQRIRFCSLGDLSLYLSSGNSLEIDKIWLSCWIFNRSITTFFTVCVGEVRFRADLLPLVKANQPVSSASSVPTVVKSNSLLAHSELLLRLLATRCGVQVHSLTLMLLNTVLPGALCHSHAKNLSVSLDHTSNRYVFHLGLEQVSSRVLCSSNLSDLCLAEACLGFSLTLAFDSLAQCVTALDVRISGLQADLHEGLFICETQKDQPDSSFETSNRRDFALDTADRWNWIKRLPGQVDLRLDNPVVTLTHQTLARRLHCGTRLLHSWISLQHPRYLQDALPTTECPMISANLLLEDSSLTFQSRQRIAWVAKLQAAFHFSPRSPISSASISSSVVLSTCRIHYQQDVFDSWKVLLLKRFNLSPPSPNRHHTGFDYFTDLALAFSGTFSHIHLSVQMSGAPQCSLGLDSLCTDLKSEPNGLLCEAALLLERFSWRVADDTRLPLAPRPNGTHVWGDAFSLKSCKVKVPQPDVINFSSPNLSSTCEVEGLQIELSESAADCLGAALAHLSPVDGLRESRGADESSWKQFVKQPLHVFFKLDGVDLFFVSRDTENLTARLDSISVSTTPSSADISVSGVAFTVIPLFNVEAQQSAQSPYCCLPATSIANLVFALPELILKFSDNPRSLQVKCGTKLEFFWSPDLYLTLLHHLQLIHVAWLARHDSPSSSCGARLITLAGRSSGVVESRGSVVSAHSRPVTVSLNLESVELRLSFCETSCASFNLQNVCAFYRLFHSSKRNQADLEVKNQTLETEFGITVTMLKAAFDEQDVLSFCELSVNRFPFHSRAATVREEVNRSLQQSDGKRWTPPQLMATRNSALVITLDSIACTFPHCYNFASTLDCALVVMKWLKELHRKPENASENASTTWSAVLPETGRVETDVGKTLLKGLKGSVHDSSNVGKRLEKEVSGKGSAGEASLCKERASLPPDVLLCVHQATLSLADSDFEVHLHDNFELQKDERAESEKRASVLGARVAALRRQHGELLPSRKVEDLYAKLAHRNSDIFVDRARKMHAMAESPRRALLSWTISDMEVIALADWSFEGKERLLGVIQQLDASSPFPSHPPDLLTSWCRHVKGSVKGCLVRIRDYPQHLLEMNQWSWSGVLAAAEPKAPPRAWHRQTLPLSQHRASISVERNLCPLKLYYDLHLDLSLLSVVWGPCWEPAWTLVGQALDLLNRPTVDPSLPLPWWDRSRLLLHGCLKMVASQASLHQLATQDPYNMTEQMHWEWHPFELTWKDGLFDLHGDLDLNVRTASKYDDCCLLRVPSLNVKVVLNWQCSGDPADHWAVVPCAPHALPALMPGSQHDSFRCFRSQSLSLTLNLNSQGGDASPQVLLYSTTLRWMHTFWATNTAVSHPVCSGSLFGNLRPSKPKLSRHYGSLSLSLSFPQLKICYWASFARQRGVEMNCGRGSVSAETKRHLLTASGSLIRRAQVEWRIARMDSDISDAYVWLISAPGTDDLNGPRKSSLLLRLSFLSYKRQTHTSEKEGGSEGDPQHRLRVVDLRACWTPANRTAAFELYEGYHKAAILKQNLSTEALKGLRLEGQESQSKRFRRQGSHGSVSSSPSPLPSSPTSPSPSSTSISSSHCDGEHLLERLLREPGGNFVVFSEESNGGRETLAGPAACKTPDIAARLWLVDLVNSQVLLRGAETAGCVLVAAAHAELLQCLHNPTWFSHGLRQKRSWQCYLGSMQYFATTDSGMDTEGDEQQWLEVKNIEEQQRGSLDSVAELIEGGQAVGGMVTTSKEGDAPSPIGQQLQRIVSRCSCWMYYVNYSHDITPTLPAPPQPPEDPHGQQDPLHRQEGAVDTFTLIHNDLEICTNPAQYAMILDILNNLLLYVEPRRKAHSEKKQRVRFQLEISSHPEEQRSGILHLQEALRAQLSQTRQLERQIYNNHKDLEECGETEELVQRIHDLQDKLTQDKADLQARSEELNILIRCFKDYQVQRQWERVGRAADEGSVVRRTEVQFALAGWQLTEQDGQLGIAALELQRFLYSKVNKSDDTAEHLLELGWFTMKSLLPSFPQEVIRPQKSVAPGRQLALRIFSRVGPPVGGISVKEHFEVNVVPLDINFTFQFFKRMMGFFFPGRGEAEEEEASEDEDKSKLVTTGIPHRHHASLAAEEPLPPCRLQSAGGFPRGSVMRRSTRKTVEPQTVFDDIDKMKQRAAKNNSFIYIKVPQVPLNVSYKGEKEKNLEDVKDFVLVLPCLEYHNCTWTWLDLALALKRDTKKALLSQVSGVCLSFSHSQARLLFQIYPPFHIPSISSPVLPHLLIMQHGMQSSLTALYFHKKI
uniref:Si:ch211-259g3.4 n=1 Tax=Eptatretus burgeri TaxID=7764 RepID=A0A8C4NNB3_EPTBU